MKILICAVGALLGSVLVASAALGLVTKATKDIRILRNKVVSWRGIEYRNADKKTKGE